MSPDQEQVLYEVAITEDLEPLEVSRETAEDLLREHGIKVTIQEIADGQFSATLRAGAKLFIPKAAQYHHAVGGQMPTGWNPRVYGIPEDIIAQVDPVTLYALVSTVEAFLSAGITDPYELYDYVQVTDIGNAIGSGMGGSRSIHRMFKQQFLDRQVQKDILSEVFINTTAAWVNMLLCGSSGPIRTPVGACATSLESVDTGVDLIRDGKAKAVLVGGTDGLESEIAHEFANMQATINSDNDAAAGRTSKESSRPMTSTQGGFVEAGGCGIQLLTSARLALDMGLPIHAIIALAHTAADGISRSVPAPGESLLSIAAEKQAKIAPSPALSIAYRRRQLNRRFREIEEKRDLDQTWLNERLSAAKDPEDNLIIDSSSVEQWRQHIDADASHARRDAQNTYGNDFWQDDPTISPLRGALAVWGLTIDDLSVASLHGTSTKQNDLNETAVIQRQLELLGRSKGNILPCVLQKSLLGHGKGAAGAFALNGCLQILRTSLIPGNRNLDNVSSDLQDRNRLFFPSRTYMNPTPIRAFSVSSFGFGQKGAQVLGVDARYLFASISEQEYQQYRAKVQSREVKANKALQDAVYLGKTVQVKGKSFDPVGKERKKRTI